MYGFVSDPDFDDEIVYDREYFAKLGKKLAEESIANLRRELKEKRAKEDEM